MKKHIDDPNVYRNNIKYNLVKYGNKNVQCLHCEGGSLRPYFQCCTCERGVDKECYEYYNKLLKINYTQPFTCLLILKFILI